MQYSNRTNLKIWMDITGLVNDDCLQVIFFWLFRDDFHYKNNKGSVCLWKCGTNVCTAKDFNKDLHAIAPLIPRWFHKDGWRRACHKSSFLFGTLIMIYWLRDIMLYQTHFISILGDLVAMTHGFLLLGIRSSVLPSCKSINFSASCVASFQIFFLDAHLIQSWSHHDNILSLRCHSC